MRQVRRPALQLLRQDFDQPPVEVIDVDDARGVGPEAGQELFELAAPRGLIKGNAEVIGIDETQIDPLLARLGKQQASPAGHVNRHRIEECPGSDLVAERLECGGKYLRQSMGALGRLPDSRRAVVDGKHGGDHRQQHLCGTDVARGFFAANVLFAGLQRHAHRRVAFAVDGNADDASRHGAPELVTRREESRVWPAVAHRHAETLRRTNGDIGTKLARRRQDSERQEVGRHHDQGAGTVKPRDEGTEVAHLAGRSGVGKKRTKKLSDIQILQQDRR